ncbi:MAG: glycoside hydrolase family 2, partial [Bacteroidota bacterium]
ILCDPDHPALADFPTDIHTDWQWWDLNKQSKAIVLDSIGVDPIVRVIDNFVTNRSLGNIFEAKVGNGKLLFTSIDLQTNLENRLVARQLRKSLMDYMQSGAFQPSEALDFAQIDDLRE